MRIKSIVSLAIVASISAPAWSEGSGDAMRGNAYAHMMCDSCHAIGVDDASHNPAATPFRLMKLNFKSGAEFATFLNTKHPVMTAPMLTENQGDDLAAYIATLKPAAAK